MKIPPLRLYLECSVHCRRKKSLALAASGGICFPFYIGHARCLVFDQFAFFSRDGHPGIKANLKATQGDLFMLEKYIFFVSKQPTLIELSDIHQCVFSRVGVSTAA